MWPFKTKNAEDVTFWITENGVTTEHRADPEKLSKLVKQAEKDGKAKRVVPVRIKGSWVGVKEEFWDFDEFGDQANADGCLYAFCVFEVGIPKYHAMDKKAWLHYDEILEIMGDCQLSDADRREKVLAIMNRA